MRQSMTFRMQRMSRVLALAGVAAALLGGAHVMRAQAQVAASGSAAAIPAQVEFNRDIRPILSDKCVKCHGPATQKGGLRLDVEESAKAELTSGGHAIVAGDALNSDMIALV